MTYSQKLKKKTTILHNVNNLWIYFTIRYSAMDVRLLVNQYSTNPAGN